MNHPLASLIEQFLKERRFLKNVTEATLVWYRRVSGSQGLRVEEKGSQGRWMTRPLALEPLNP